MRVFSAMQPSGQLHLGNYFGSMKPNLAWQGRADLSFFMVVDLHALTTLHDPEVLRRSREDMVLDCLACGFDPDKSVLCFQSDVPEHTGLAWILSTVTPMGLLERAVSYKEKVGKGIPATAGLFTYPVLMAADILLYRADKVPVGKDQKQHVEIARDIAGKFNTTYGNILKLPVPEIAREAAVVPGTDGEKMSKSYGNTIPLFAPEKEIEKAVMRIVTDSLGPTDPKDPEKSIVFQIHRLFLNTAEQKALAGEYRRGIAYGDAKKRLFSTYMDAFAPFRRRRDALKKSDVRAVMEEGALRARKTAGETMEQVYKAVGLD